MNTRERLSFGKAFARFPPKRLNLQTENKGGSVFNGFKPTQERSHLTLMGELR